MVFITGLIAGIAAGMLVLIGFAAVCCVGTYGSWKTFTDVCNVVNRESELIAVHEGEILEEVVLKEV